MSVTVTGECGVCCCFLSLLFWKQIWPCCSSCPGAYGDPPSESSAGIIDLHQHHHTQLSVSFYVKYFQHSFSVYIIFINRNTLNKVKNERNSYIQYFDYLLVSRKLLSRFFYHFFVLFCVETGSLRRSS